MAGIPWIDYKKTRRANGKSFTLSDLQYSVFLRMPHLYQADVYKAVNAIIERMAQALIDGDEIRLKGFGQFEVIERPPRYWWNPMKGKYVKVGARRQFKFQADAEFREEVLGKKGLWGSGYKKRQKLNPPLGASAVMQADARKADWDRRRQEMGIPSMEEQELLDGDDGAER